MKKIYRIFLGAQAGFLLALFAAAPAWALTVKVEPSVIPITFSYHGAVITIKGEAADSEEVLIRIGNAPRVNIMKFKGKVGGIFWMKKGELKFTGLPQVYLLYSSNKLKGMVAAGELQKYQIGYDVLVEKAKAMDKSGKPVDRKWVKEFFKFKEGENLYGIFQNSISKKGQGGDLHYQAKIQWPFQIAPGIYQVEVLGLKNGMVTQTSKSSIEVKRVGIGAFLSKMAVESAAFYGIMAIAIALLAGFAVGAIFKKGGGGH